MFWCRITKSKLSWFSDISTLFNQFEILTVRSYIQNGLLKNHTFEIPSEGWECNFNMWHLFEIYVYSKYPGYYISYFCYFMDFWDSICTCLRYHNIIHPIFTYFDTILNCFQIDEMMSECQAIVKIPKWSLYSCK